MRTICIIVALIIIFSLIVQATYKIAEKEAEQRLRTEYQSARTFWSKRYLSACKKEKDARKLNEEAKKHLEEAKEYFERAEETKNQARKLMKEFRNEVIHENISG